MSAISTLISLLNLGCLIFVVIKMYPKEGALKAVLGFICGLYAFVWGWQHIKTEEDANFKNVMYVWTGLVVLAVIVNSIVRAQG